MRDPAKVPGTAESTASRIRQWFSELRAPLRRFIAGRPGLASADLDDVAQEVFLRLLRYDREELVNDPRSYLFRIAANVASEWAMRAQRRYPHHSGWLEEIEDAADLQTALELADRERAIHAAIGMLRSRPREILRLHFGEGLTHEGIAARLGISRRTVKREIVEAYAALRVSLADLPDGAAATRPGPGPADALRGRS